MSAEPPLERSTIRAIAQAGNAVAVFAILLLLVNSAVLFTATVPPPPAAAEASRNRRLLLVVIDGLRADAVTPMRMPHVHALAQRGALRTSRVETLLPSTVAGLRALIEGVIVPPAEFVSDFRSRHAPSGGLIEAVHRSGGRVFAAGPYLWTDLYGQWIGGGVAVQGLARDDRSVLRVALGACMEPHWNLIAVQFCRPDVMAHMHGAESREYAESVAWCDRAVGELVRSVGNETLIAITSDHGVTLAGGHAGAEPDVLNTPLIVSDASIASPFPAVVSQPHLPHLLAGAMGVRLPVSQGVAVPPPASLRIFASIAAALVGGIAVIVLLGSSANAHPPGNVAFGLNASVWSCIAVAWLNPWVGGALALVSLTIHARRGRAPVSRFVVFAFGSGLAVGMLRVASPALIPGIGASVQASQQTIAVACLCAFAVGYFPANRCRSVTHASWLGAGMLAIAPVLSGLLGESVSLSTLDVRLAFRFFESPLGLSAAVIVAAIRPFLPLLFLVVGVVYGWKKQRCPETWIAALGVGAGGLLAGELAFASVLLSSSTSQSLSALSLGLLLRECALVTILYPMLAGAALFLRNPARMCHKSATLRSRAFHQA